MAEASLKRLKFRLKEMQEWVKRNKLEFIFLLLILITGAFFRFYKISQYMTFLGDEGRDAIIVRKILVDFNLVFVGPGTSVGNMYLGPIYYYMMAPFLFFSRFNPVGPSIMVAILAVATIYLVWLLTRRWFGKSGAIAAALLYAVSPVVIIFSKHSWNPNIMPFFAILTVYSIWKVWQENKWSWIIIAGLSFGVVVQSHYLGILILPVLILFWLLSFIKSLRTKAGKNKAIAYTLYSAGFFLLLISPLILFDAKHGWINFKSIETFLLERQGTLSFDPIISLERIYPIWRLIVTRLLAGKEIWLGQVLAATLLMFIIFLIYGSLKNKLPELHKKAFILLGVWLGMGIIGLSFYNQVIIDHYFGFLFPAPFILSGALIQIINNNRLIALKVSAIIIIGIMLLFSLKNNPLRTSPGRQMQNTIEVAKKIQEESYGKRYNFAVIADRNYEGAYQYFLELWNTPITIIDPQNYKSTLAEQLFVVCEYEDRIKCQPASNPKTEIANFGWSKIEKSWEIDGVILFKMIHNIP